MRNLTSTIALIYFLLSFTSDVKAHVGLDYPQGGETFIVGETITIQWHVIIPHNTLNWDLYFSIDGGMTWDTLQLDIPTSNLSYEWVIPGSFTSQGRIQVVQDNEDQNYLDNSMDFIIAPNTDPPILDEPANDIILECNMPNQEAAIQAWLDNNGGASVTNYCENLAWTNDYAGYSNDCGATGSTLVIFTAADDCGVIITNATMTIADTSPPDIDIPAANLTVQSNGQGNLAQLNSWLNNQAGAQASDECGEVNWSHNYTMLDDGCGSTGSAEVIFTATDACGNTSTTIATFAIEDHLVPNIIIAATDTALTCGASNQQNAIQQWLNHEGGAEALDVGGDVTWTHNFTGLSDNCGLTGSANVIFTVTDECGNTNTTVAAITIEDNVSPVIEVEAQHTTIVCGINNQPTDIQNWLNQHGGAIASDICGSVSWTHNFTALSDTCGPVGTYDITFTATDACGNASSTNAFLTITDSLTTGISELGEFDFTIYPNPASDHVTITLDQPGVEQINLSLLDSFGRVIWSDMNNTKEILIPLQKYPEGLYFLQVKTTKGILARSFIIH